MSVVTEVTYSQNLITIIVILIMYCSGTENIFHWQTEGICYNHDSIIYACMNASLSVGNFKCSIHSEGMIKEA